MIKIMLLSSTTVGDVCPQWVDTIFFQRFVATWEQTKDDDDLKEVHFVCKVGTEIMSFLNEMKICEDKLISTCAIFLEMSYDFNEFVNPYRIGDSISIEYGYQKQAPTWEALAQNKFVDIFYG